MTDLEIQALKQSAIDWHTEATDWRSEWMKEADRNKALASENAKLQKALDICNDEWVHSEVVTERDAYQREAANLRRELCVIKDKLAELIKPYTEGRK